MSKRKQSMAKRLEEAFDKALDSKFEAINNFLDACARCDESDEVIDEQEEALNALVAAQIAYLQASHKVVMSAEEEATH
jgi:hypothetical protein